MCVNPASINDMLKQQIDERRTGELLRRRFGNEPVERD
jgi:hypothetical protein